MIATNNNNRAVLDIRVVGGEGLSQEQLNKLNQAIQKTESEDILLANGQTLSKEELKGAKGETGLSAYQIAVQNGFQGDENAWLESIKGTGFSEEEKKQIIKKGNGKDILLADGTTRDLSSLKQDIINEVNTADLEVRAYNDNIQYRYNSNDTWKNLLHKSSLKGTSEKTFEVRKDNNLLQWKLTEDTQWTPLCILSDLFPKEVKYIEKNNIIGDFRNFIQIISKIHSNIVFKNGTYDIELINTVGITPKQGCTLSWESQALINVLPNNLEVYNVFDLRGTSHITLNNPQIEGDKHKHLGTTGQWGYAITAANCNNIVINNPKISKMWGDAINIRNSEKIKIFNPELFDNRRQGISIEENVDDVEIYNPNIKGTGGQNPGYGIDIEPNWNGKNITNVRIFNPIFSNNANNNTSYPAGFALSLHRAGIAEKEGKALTDFNISVELINPTFIGDACIITAETDYVKGYIKVVNPRFINSRKAALYFLSHISKFFTSEIIRPEFIDCVTDTNEYNNRLAPILFQSSYERQPKRGNRNIHIIEPTFIANPEHQYNHIGIINATDTTFPEDLVNVLIEDAKFVGYKEYIEGVSYGHVDKSFKFTQKSSSELPVRKGATHVNVDTSYKNTSVSYQGDSQNPMVYLRSELKPSGIEYTYENLSALKKDLTLKFGSPTVPHSVLIDGFSEIPINELKIPYGAKAKFLKIEENKFKAIDMYALKNVPFSKEFTPEVIAPTTVVTTTVDYPNVVVGDVVLASFTKYHQDIELSAVVSEPNKVVVKFKNTGQQSVTLGAGNINLKKL